jgi:type I restriction enzyme M protein
VDERVLQVCAKGFGSDERVHLRRANALWFLNEFEGQFDLVATNPPFSAKYGRVTDAALLRRYELGCGRDSEAMEVLFLELCVRSLKNGGMLAIVLPEGAFANLPQRRVRERLIRRTTPVAIVSLSRDFFSAKSCVLFARKKPASPDARWAICGERESDGQTAGEDEGGRCPFRPRGCRLHWAGCCCAPR